MTDRNLDRTVYKNDSDLYRERLKNKNVKEIYHYGKFRLNPVTIEERRSLTVLDHHWGPTDRLYKLSFKYYGITDYWWVIAWYNQKPMDFMYTHGQKVYIPLPLEDAIRLATRET